MCQNCLAGRAIEVELHWLALGQIYPELSAENGECHTGSTEQKMAAEPRPRQGVVGYNVQVAVDTDHHLIIAHEVTNTGSDRAQLANIASQAKQVLGVDEFQAVADRGYYSGPEILACHESGIAVSR